MQSGKTALVLSGGGSRGAYEIGVWQALGELGEQIDIVTGTSVGAINGAVIAQGSLEMAQKLWQQLLTSKVFDVELDESLPTLQKRRLALAAFSKKALEQGGAGTTALYELLKQFIDEKKVYESPVELGIVTCRLDNLRPVYLWKEQMGENRLHDYLLATSALFPAVRPHVIDQIRYIDGGYADNMPVRMAVEKGAARIFAVNMKAIGLVHPIPTGKGLRVIQIKPYWDLGGLLFFDPDLARQNMRLGYLDAMRACGVFDGVAYAFIKGAYNRLARRYTSFYQLLGRMLGISGEGGLLETAACLPLQKRVGARLGSRTCTVAGLALDGAESAAELLGLDPGCIYSLERFDERLAQALQKSSAPEAQRLRALAETAAAAMAGKGSAALLPALALHPAAFSAALYLVSAELVQ